MVYEGQSNSIETLIVGFRFSKEEEHIIFERLTRKRWS